MNKEIKKQMPQILQIIQKTQEEILNQTGITCRLMPVISVKPINEEVCELFENMCAHWGDTLLSISGTFGNRTLVAKRQILWMAAKIHFPEVGFKMIGICTNTLNHSTVLKGINKGYGLMQIQDEYFMKYFEPVKQYFDVTAKS